jgi:hypothetical protein
MNFIPLMHRRAPQDVALEGKIRALTVESGLPMWFVGNVLRWRLKKRLPVFQLAVREGSHPLVGSGM